MVIACSLAGVGVLLQLLTNGRYGYFRDELYFIATSKHLAFGYVDLAPLSAFVLRMSRAMFGDSLHAIRLLPALAYGVEILLTALITTELGGKAIRGFSRMCIGLARPSDCRQCHTLLDESLRTAVLDGLRVLPCACDPAE